MKVFKVTYYIKGVGVYTREIIANTPQEASNLIEHNILTNTDLSIDDFIITGVEEVNE